MPDGTMMYMEDSSASVQNTSQEEKKVSLASYFNLIKKTILFLFAIFVLGALFLGLKKITNQPLPKHPIANKFQLVESSPNDYDGAFSPKGQPTFVFSKDIGVSESNLGQYFHISPAVPGKWHLEKNGQVVYFSSDTTQANDFPNTLRY